MKISEYLDDGRIFYLEVESNYKVLDEGKGQDDAVNFFMGQELVESTDSLISVRTEDARKFAQSILTLCDQIEGNY